MALKAKPLKFQREKNIKKAAGVCPNCGHKNCPKSKGKHHCPRCMNIF